MIQRLTRQRSFLPVHSTVSAPRNASRLQDGSFGKPVCIEVCWAPEIRKRPAAPRRSAALFDWGRNSNRLDRARVRPHLNSRATGEPSGGKQVGRPYSMPGARSESLGTALCVLHYRSVRVLYLSLGVFSILRPGLRPHCVSVSAAGSRRDSRKPPGGFL